jgi:hypothetical protein
VESLSGYQPDWVDGKEVGVGWRDCAARYQAIADHLKAYGPLSPPKVLDVGAYTGYFCRRLYSDFRAQCVAVDSNSRLRPSEGVTVINETITPDGIRELGHFDAALCLSVLHHHKNWYEYLGVLLEVADICYIETANPQENLGSHRAYAVGAHNELSKMGEVLCCTAPMTGEKNHLRSLWVVDRRIVRGEEEQVAIVTDILNGFEANTPDDQFHVSPESAKPIAGGLVHALDYYGWKLVYDPAVTVANLAKAVEANPAPHMAVPPKPQSLAEAIAEARFGRREEHNDTSPWTDQ